jgi:DNA-binding NarL/FixJ family response regulator
VSVRVLIADDQELVRTGFRMILGSEPDIDVVGEACNGREAVSMARNMHPDVVLMDIRMPELDGIEATKQVVALNAAEPIKVLMLTTFDLDEYVYDALRAGASGFLLKDVPAAQLAAGVRMVAGGDALLAPTITRRLIEEFAATPPAGAPPAGFDELTPRELEVFRLVARGLSNAEIAAELVIGETTVKTHVTRLLLKLGLRDRVQAVVLAYEAGIVSPTRGQARPAVGPGATFG